MLIDNYCPKISNMRPEGFGVLLGVFIDSQPVYLPIEYSDTQLKTVEVTKRLLRYTLKRYDLLSLYDDKKLPGCSDGALTGVTKELESSRCMSHGFACIVKNYMKNYLVEQYQVHWKNLQTFWSNASHAPDDKNQSFNKWIKSNEKPSSDDLEYINEYMNETVNITGDFTKTVFLKTYFEVSHK